MQSDRTGQHAYGDYQSWSLCLHWRGTSEEFGMLSFLQWINVCWPHLGTKPSKFGLSVMAPAWRHLKVTLQVFWSVHFLLVVHSWSQQVGSPLSYSVSIHKHIPLYVCWLQCQCGAFQQGENGIWLWMWVFRSWWIGEVVDHQDQWMCEHIWPPWRQGPSQVWTHLKIITLHKCCLIGIMQ